MRTALSGVWYDTEKSTLIGKASVSRPGLASWQAGLYRTPHGKRYFLYGEGALMTRFAKQPVVPLTTEEAREWAREFLGEELE